MRARDQLMEQNLSLDLSRREAERAVGARNSFLAVMNHAMRTPLHAIISLSSLLLEAELAPEHRMTIETVLKSSTFMATLLHDTLDTARLEDGDLQLEAGVFNLPSLFREVRNPSFFFPGSCQESFPSLTSSTGWDPPVPVTGDRADKTHRGREEALGVVDFGGGLAAVGRRRREAAHTDHHEPRE